MVFQSKKSLAGQRISNKLLKKKFFIHLFFNLKPQYLKIIFFRYKNHALALDFV